MPSFYFTFGSHEAFPFYGGWVEVKAPNIDAACKAFRRYYPDRIDGVLNCSDYYTEDQFDAAGFEEKGNRGRYCHRLSNGRKQNNRNNRAHRSARSADIQVVLARSLVARAPVAAWSVYQFQCTFPVRGMTP